MHFFDFVMWYFEALGDPTSVLAVGNSKGRTAGMSDNLTTIVRFPCVAYPKSGRDMRASCAAIDR